MPTSEKYVVTRKFATSVERTERVLEVAESFGLGLTDKEFVVYENLELDIRDGDVVYIAGQSGSGKSLLLKDVIAQMRSRGKSVADLNEIALEDKPIIELLGRNTTEALELLSAAGVSDAWIYIRKPSELSDGQRYRLKLAKVMESAADVWVADEFGAVLDRETAKAVAFNIQKTARKHGKTLLVATTHLDLREELGPNLFVHKRFRDRIDMEKSE